MNAKSAVIAKAIIAYALLASIASPVFSTPLTLTIQSGSLFCLLLPPNPGGNIAASEDDAIPFCTQASPKGAPGAQQFPAGFITSAHFVQAADYVQVTGTIDIAAYKLSAYDEGGQYDDKAPAGAIVSGYRKFVSLIDPSAGIFCIRACTNASDCILNKSAYGCETVIPGDYSISTSMKNLFQPQLLLSP